MAKRNILRRTLLASAMVAATLAAQPALSQSKDCKKDCAPAQPQPQPQPAPKPAPVEQSQSKQTIFDPLGGRIRIFEGEVDSLGGRIRIFDGDIDPLGGRIRIFEDDIDPLKGNIRIFWGDLAPKAGELDPKIGRIRIFTDDFFSRAEKILASWDGNDPAALEAAIRALIAQGKAQWGDQIAAQTGKSFDKAFADAFLAKWNLSASDLSSLHTWDAWTRQAFLIDWHDNLLNYSGLDQIDHWMNAVNWSPALTQVQGGGATTTIGVLDFFAPADADVNSKTVYEGGYRNIDNAHGAAVSSLLVSSHDGRGIMGIAPNATIAGYNPFDETYTASWEDVQSGIIAVGKAKASVVNLSLGVSGYTLPDDWRDLFKNSKVEQFRDSTVYVIAAGNDGITQTQDVEFGGALDTTFIVVGSVDVTGQISAFSNRPGKACLLDNGKCTNANANLNGRYGNNAEYLREGGLLMHRFLVAPGELILVSDGQGGVTRASGTSFAAPLVTGAIALIHDRWPWLRDHPFDVAKAIFESAQDLGAPGVDPVYGWGLLDIEASQSALDFNDLSYYLVDKKGKTAPQKINKLRKDGVQSSWQTNNAYFVAFEELVNSNRDFLIPLSSRLFNTSVNGQTMQEFMYHRFVSWLDGGASKSGFTSGFTDMNHTPAVPFGDGWSFSMSGRQNIVSGNQFLLRPYLESTVAINAPDNAFGFAFGLGDASALVGGQGNLGLTTDYNPVTGGANPLLGFAAGGRHFAASARLADGLRFSLATTRRDGSVDENIAREDFGLDDRALIDSRGDYQAAATTVRVDYNLSGASTLSMAFTMLDEQDALFGVRSIEPTDFGGGVRTTGATLAADFDLGAGINLFGSVTAARSAAGQDANLRVTGTLSSAFQAGMAKHGVIGRSDNLRVTVAQPLTLERGFIDAQLVGVVDRQTGEKGIINERFDITNAGPRRYVAEGHYAAPVMGGAGEVTLFARAELRPSANLREDNSDVLGGVSFRVAF
jgi:hypothetical protein